MHSKHFSFLATAILAAAWSAHAQQSSPVPDVPGLPPAARAAAASIDSEKIRAHVRFLSLDLLEGRGLVRAARSWPPSILPHSLRWPGSSRRATTAPIFRRSRSSLSTRRRTKLNSPSCLRAAQPVDLAYGTEIVAKDQTGQTTADFDAPIVFVGYGIHAPEYNWDDYAGSIVRESRAGHRQRAAFGRSRSSSRARRSPTTADGLTNMRRRRAAAPSAC